MLLVSKVKSTRGSQVESCSFSAVHKALAVVGLMLFAAGFWVGMRVFSELPPPQPLAGVPQQLVPISCGSPWNPASNLPYMPVGNGHFLTPCVSRLHERQLWSEASLGAGVLLMLGAAVWASRQPKHGQEPVGITDD